MVTYLKTYILPAVVAATKYLYSEKTKTSRIFSSLSQRSLNYLTSGAEWESKFIETTSQSQVIIMLVFVSILNPLHHSSMS